MQKILAPFVLCLGLIFAYSPEFYVAYIATFMPERFEKTVKALFSEPYILPAILVPFLVFSGIWIARAFFEKSKDSFWLLWVIATIPVMAFIYDSFAKPYLNENFGWKCEDCEMRAFFKDKINEKKWFPDFKMFKNNEPKFCKDLGKKPNVKVGDVQKFVLILSENIDWLQRKIEEKNITLPSGQKEIRRSAFAKISGTSSFYQNYLDACWGGLASQYLEKVGKLYKVQLKLYDELLRGAEA